jgi:hypothetical protein
MTKTPTVKELWDLYQVAAERDRFSDETKRAHARYARAITKARKQRKLEGQS